MTEDNDIPREVEDAVLHVICQKMLKSTLPNNSISFKSGGPRVSNLHLNNFYKIKV